MERIGLGNRCVISMAMIPPVILRSTLFISIDGYVDLVHGGGIRGGVRYSRFNSAYANDALCLHTSNFDGMCPVCQLIVSSDLSHFS